MTKNPLPNPSAPRLHLGLWVALALLVLLLWWVRGALTPFVTGLVLAYMLAPLVNKLHGMGWPRVVAALLPSAAFYILLLGGILGGIPLLIAEITGFVSQLPQVESWAPRLLTQVESTIGFTLNLETILTSMASYGAEILSGSLQGLGAAVAGVSAIGSIGMFLLITPLVTFYLLLEWPRLPAFMRSVIPPAARDEVMDILGRIDAKVAGFIRGQLLVALIQGIYYAIGLTLVGLQLGFVLGLLTGLLTLIPVVGGLLMMVVTFIVTLIQFQLTDWVPYVLVAAVFATGSILESVYLSPKILGHQVNLHPVWVLFALIIGGHLAGIVGMLLAVPVAAVVSELATIGLERWRNSTYFRNNA